MEDNNRTYRRSRPRPFDLRRKVLLKNFLREQMTHIPEIKIESVSQNNSANFTESSVSDHSEGTPQLHEETSSTNTTEYTNDIPSSSDNNNSDDMHVDSKVDVLNINNSNALINSTDDSGQESSMFKFASLKFKRESKKTLKGILKAKEVYKSVRSPIKTRSFKSGLQRVFYGRKRPNESSSSSQPSRNSPKSLFSMFKSRREQRHSKEVDRIKRSPCVNLIPSEVSSKYNTINQSSQTDDSWVREEMYKVQQSNKRLKEENRLLSESLSYFMSSSSMDPHVRHSNSPLQSSNKNVNTMVFPDYFVSSSNSTNNNWNSRSRVSRSKSVHEYSERRNLLRNNYRTRSVNFNFHNSQSNVPIDTKPSVSTYGAEIHVPNIPRVRRKNVLANVHYSNSSRSIQRRSSMPERTLSENDRSVICRRSGSVRDTRSRTPFYDLPSEAFY